MSSIGRIQQRVYELVKSPDEINEIINSKGISSYDTWVEVQNLSSKSKLFASGELKTLPNAMKLFHYDFEISSDIQTRHSRDVVASKVTASPLIMYFNDEPECVRLYDWMVKGNKVKVTIYTMATMGQGKVERSTWGFSGFIIHLADQGDYLECAVCFDSLDIEEKPIDKDSGNAKASGSQVTKIDIRNGLAH